MIRNILQQQKEEREILLRKAYIPHFAERYSEKISCQENTTALRFVELLRRDYKPELGLFYYRTRNNREIDFVIRRGHRIEQLIQVCYNMDQLRVKKRETDALKEAAKELNCTNLLLITWDKEETIETDTLKITILPAYKWLMNI